MRLTACVVSSFPLLTDTPLQTRLKTLAGSPGHFVARSIIQCGTSSMRRATAAGATGGGPGGSAPGPPRSFVPLPLSAVDIRNRRSRVQEPRIKG
jgi:hypothetical protein